jgi:hypothetical protein
VVKKLIEQWEDVNRQGGQYGNALQAASWGGHEKVVQMLLDAGADVKAQRGVYSTALQAASDRGHWKVVQMLLDAGADVNARAIGETFEAALKNCDDLAVKAILKDHFADLTSSDTWSWLEEMIHRGYNTESIADLLLEHEEEGPWIHFDPWVTSHRLPLPKFHVAGCAHRNEHYANDAGSPVSLQQGDDVAMLENLTTSAAEQRQVVTSLCGLAGIVPRTPYDSNWIRGASFDGDSTGSATVTYGTVGATEHLIIGRCHSALQAFCTATAESQRYGGCCDSYTILCQVAEEAAKLREVDLKLAVQLLSQLESFLQGRVKSLNDCKALAEEIISSVLVLHGDGPRSSSSILGASSLCALAVQLLCVSFVSYCQGLVGPLNLFFLERDLAQVHLYGAEPTDRQAPLAAKLQRLSCLDDMLEGPVLVFTRETEQARRRLDLVATPEQILDIWGPGSIFAGSITETVTRPPCIVVGGGVIFPTDGGKFHWDRRMRMPSSSVSTLIDLRAEIRVGVVLENVSSACSQNLEAVRARSAEYRRPLGTCEPFWHHDREREIGA